MTLFDSNPQYRERATLFRVFSLLPLFSSLLSGCVCRWFAVNIRMDLVTNDGYAGDIDIIACLNRWPNNLSPWPNNQSPWPSDTRKQRSFCRTWEVKVAKLHENGEARSLKGGGRPEKYCLNLIFTENSDLRMYRCLMSTCARRVFSQTESGISLRVRNSQFVQRFRNYGATGMGIRSSPSDMRSTTMTTLGCSPHRILLARTRIWPWTFCSPRCRGLDKRLPRLPLESIAFGNRRRQEGRLNRWSSFAGSVGR
jgi:hypothetical protein